MSTFQHCLFTFELFNQHVTVKGKLWHAQNVVQVHCTIAVNCDWHCLSVISTQNDCIFPKNHLPSLMKKFDAVLSVFHFGTRQLQGLWWSLCVHFGRGLRKNGWWHKPIQASCFASVESFSALDWASFSCSNHAKHGEQSTLQERWQKCVLARLRIFEKIEPCELWTAHPKQHEKSKAVSFFGFAVSDSILCWQSEQFSTVMACLGFKNNCSKVCCLSQSCTWMNQGRIFGLDGCSSNRILCDDSCVRRMNCEKWNARFWIPVHCQLSSVRRPFDSNYKRCIAGLTLWLACALVLNHIGNVDKIHPTIINNLQNHSRLMDAWSTE